MGKTREQLKAEMRAEAEALIDQLLAWREQVDKPNLKEFEEAMLPLREAFGKQLVQDMIENEEAARPVSAPCPHCGAEAAYKGSKEVEIQSRLGSLRLRRAYYYCSRCGRGFFPSGPAVGDGGKSLE
ncbi:MAG: hypothetical protein QXQ53_09375 [Candidatus Methanosuratincola sp.]